MIAQESLKSLSWELEGNKDCSRSVPKIWDKATSEVAIGDYIKMPYHPVWLVAGKEETSDRRTRLAIRDCSGNSEEWYLPPAQPAWSLDELEKAIADLKRAIGKLPDANSSRDRWR